MRFTPLKLSALLLVFTSSVHNSFAMDEKQASELAKAAVRKQRAMSLGALDNGTIDNKPIKTAKTPDSKVDRKSTISIFGALHKFAEVLSEKSTDKELEIVFSTPTIQRTQQTLVTAIDPAQFLNSITQQTQGLRKAQEGLKANIDSGKAAVLMGLIEELEAQILRALQFVSGISHDSKEQTVAGDTFQNLKRMLQNVAKAVYWASGSTAGHTEMEKALFDQMLADYTKALIEGCVWKYNQSDASASSPMITSVRRTRRATTVTKPPQRYNSLPMTDTN